jgi:hypothetical protein
MFYEDVQAVVDRAAELLPEPPRPGDWQARARWEDLLIATGRRLATLLDADTDLLRSLMGEERCLPAACRQRRGLLLRVALCSTLEMRKATLPASGVCRLQPAEGSASAHSVLEAPRRLTLRRSSPEA